MVLWRWYSLLYGSCNHRGHPVLTPSFPTRRSHALAPGCGRAASSPAEPGASSDLPAAVEGDHAAQNGLDPGLGETGLGEHRPKGFHIGETADRDRQSTRLNSSQ